MVIFLKSISLDQCVWEQKKTGSGVYSGKNDSRVTKVGKIIRATSIDELPQFLIF